MFETKFFQSNVRVFQSKKKQPTPEQKCSRSLYSYNLGTNEGPKMADPAIRKNLMIARHIKSPDQPQTVHIGIPAPQATAPSFDAAKKHAGITEQRVQNKREKLEKFRGKIKIYLKEWKTKQELKKLQEKLRRDAEEKENNPATSSKFTRKINYLKPKRIRVLPKKKKSAKKASPHPPDKQELKHHTSSISDVIDKKTESPQISVVPPTSSNDVVEESASKQSPIKTPQQLKAEKKRYMLALRNKLMEKVKEKNITIPALCNCGVSPFEDHATLCCNNCVFYDNPKAYVEALTSLLYSLQIDTLH